MKDRYKNRRKEIKQTCKTLEKFWLKIPYQRFGQLLENYVFGAEHKCIFYIPDKDIKKALRKEIE